jgi:hypothetical protein
MPIVKKGERWKAREGCTSQVFRRSLEKRRRGAAGCDTFLARPLTRSLLPRAAVHSLLRAASPFLVSIGVLFHRDAGLVLSRTVHSGTLFPHRDGRFRLHSLLQCGRCTFCEAREAREGLRSVIFGS